MPTLIQSTIAKGSVAAPYPHYSGELVVKRATVTVPAGVAANDVFELLSVPPGCRFVDAILDADDLDTNGAPTITFDVGVMTGTFGTNDSSRTVGQELFVASAVGKTGTTERASAKTAFRDAAASGERAIGAKCVAAPATGAAGTLGLTLFYVAD